ncbi:hypothetical protein DICSQDRAFT_156257 [Dichomitus squalens LYAD-421 SS1]|uniref:Uncharacterized protein n=1 Tax=Dichomitus squalens (strain LYAD-421) TaxID=732165 RepID=R7STN1_DICSQ|nr:uncharacterized protein DICSQDRAFT_156257 [Dichomitus squalens LYAD-421 SS1]EJF59584.1 hypothetical protein DICSQDRAFT_156257 [Dichomitus squalens LYAD-421 SS1]
MASDRMGQSPSFPSVLPSTHFSQPATERRSSHPLSTMTRLSSTSISPRNFRYCFQTLSGHGSTVWALAFLDGHFLASVSNDTTIRIWERVQEHKWEGIDTLSGPERSVYSISWAVGKRFGSGDAGSLGWLASTGGDGICNITRGAPLHAKFR